MKLMSLAALAVLAFGLASCGPSRMEYEARVAALEGSPKLRADAYQNCFKQQRSPDWIKYRSKLMNVPESKARAVYCQRFIDGMASGRIAYEDLAFNTNGKMNSKVVKVFQGRK